MPLLVAHKYHEECPHGHGHKKNPKMTPWTCRAMGKQIKVILKWIRPWASKTPPTHGH